MEDNFEGKGFVKYNSIENSYRQKFIDKLMMEGYTEGSWAIKEKVHGANASITVYLNEDGEFEILPGRRSGYIGEGVNFHGIQAVAANLAETLVTMFQEIGCVEKLTVFGEIFGGNYPHPDVKPGERSQVQKGVFYSPEVEFLAFDLKIEGVYVPTIKADQLFKEYEVPHLPTLFTGTFKECLAKDALFESTIPGMYGLPAIENNKAEGFVMKPYETVPFLPSGTRVILKQKTEAFKEVQKKSKVKVEEVLPENVAQLVQSLNEHCTSQRVAAVISKIGTVTMKDFGTVMKQTNQDVLEEFNKNHSEELNVLDKKTRSLITKRVGAFNADIIKAYFRENV